MGADAVQVFTQSPRTWRPTNHARRTSSGSRSGARRRGSAACSCHALYLVNLASPKDDFYEKSVAALCEHGRRRVRDRGGRGRLPRRLASRRGHRRRARARRAGDEEGARPLLGHDVAADGELRRRGRHDRPLDRGAGADLRPARTATRGSASASTRATCTCPAYDVTDEAALDAMLDELDRAIGLDRLRALHVNDSEAPLGSNRDRHANIGEGLMGEEARRVPRAPEAAGPAGGARGARGRTATARTRPRSEARRSCTPGLASKANGRQQPPRTEPARTTAPRGPAAGLPPFSAYPGKRARLSPDRADFANSREPSVERAPGPLHGRLRHSGARLTCAKIRKLGSPSGSSWNSGLTQPRSSSRPS